RLGQAVLRIEWYPVMDVLLEVEGEPAEIERAIAATGLPRDRFFPESLPHFVAAYEARTGRPARIAEGHAGARSRSRCRCACRSSLPRWGVWSCRGAWRNRGCRSTTFGS